MKKLLLVLPLGFLWLMSCKQEEKILVEKEITFSIANPAQTGSNGGRIAAAAEPKSVLVTIKDIDGTTVADRKELTLYKFGENFLSLPLTLKTSGASKYHLTEFLVVSTDNKVNYATPKEGSKLAHLVADPLDIEFAVRKDTITTVTPGVLAIDENTNPEDYGYGQFGFKVVKTIRAVFSAFLKGTNNFELTTAHLKIQGLRDSTSRDTTSLWVYETNLEAKANTVQLKEAALYRVTSTKQGYKPWHRTLAIKNNDKFEILFEKNNAWSFETLWNKNYGGSSSDLIDQTISTSDGGTLLVGSSYSNDHDVTQVSGQSDAWILKLSPSGNVQWSKNYSNSFWDFARSVTEYDDGSGYLISGNSTSLQSSSNNGWLLKIDTNGNIVWEKSTGSEIFYESTIAINASTNFLLIGSKSLGTTTIRQIDEVGNLVWEKSIPYRSNELSTEVVKIEDAYIVTVHRSIIKLNAQGGVEWKKNPLNTNGNHDFIVSGVRGGYLLFATEGFPYTYPDGAIGSMNDLVICQLDRSGDIIQKKTIASPLHHREVLFDAVKTTSGNYLLVGGILLHPSNVSENEDSWIIEITPQGEVVGEKFLRGTTSPTPAAYSYFKSIIPLGNEYIITGSTNDNGGDIPGNYGSTDLWAMKIRF